MRERVRLLAGRKRHIAVDTIGLLLTVLVTAASVQDRDAAKPLLRNLKRHSPRSGSPGPTAATPSSVIRCRSQARPTPSSARRRHIGQPCCRRAVRTGQLETARVITAAAAIMICVFLTFAFLGQRPDGRRDRRHVRGRTRSEVVAKVRALERQRDAGLPLASGRVPTRS